MCNFVCYSYFTVRSSTVTIHLFVMEKWLHCCVGCHTMKTVDTMHHEAIEGESAWCVFSIYGARNAHSTVCYILLQEIVLRICYI